MTSDFLSFLQIYSCAVTNKNIVVPEFNIESVCRIAIQQNAIGFICYAINKVYGKEIKNEVFNRCNERFLMEYTLGFKQRIMALKILEKISASGRNYKLLKGLCLGNLYPDPVIRRSADVDLLVAADEISGVVDDLVAQGFVAEIERDESHHISCKHEMAGLFEIHHRLYDECFDEAWFESKFTIEEDTIYVNIDGVEIPTLGYTDGMIFNYLHLIKHFLLTGITIQQISDILLYVKEYKTDINWNRVFELLVELKYDTFFYGLLTIGTKYLNFEEKDMPEFTKNDMAADCILTDLERGGAYGSLERKERDKFYHKYTKDRFEADRKGINYEKFIAKKKHINIITRIFSRKEILQERYPVIKKHGWLLPIGWVMRWWDGAKKIILGEITVSEYVNIMPDADNEIIKSRMEIANKLNML